MKIIQYRFSSNALGNIIDIANRIQSFFRERHDIYIRSVSVNSEYPYNFLINHIDVMQISECVRQSFLESFSDNIDYRKYMSIRSNTSCRFVIFEEDGLVRFCYKSDDDPLDFDPKIIYSTEDVSHLLLETDLFD